jgi:ATP-dependent 26S proteasome regulatory subunit
VALAENHELAGGAITNVVRYAAICATREGRSAVSQRDLLNGITKELIKEGRAF